MPEIKIKNEKSLYDAAELFKLFSDASRIRILYSLLNKEKSVSEIYNELNMNQSAVSHQLRLLKNSKLIKNRKEGKIVYYSLADKHVHNMLSQGIKHVEEKR